MSATVSKQNRPSLSTSNIVFWQNIPSILQAPIIFEVARHVSARVLMVAEGDVSSGRREQGWQRPDFGAADVVVSPSRAERRRLLKAAGSDAIHIFTGIHAFPETYWTFRQAVAGGATVGLYAESVDDSGWRGALKRGLYWTHALRWGGRLDFMLLTGERARQWFGARGFSTKRMFPYGYFTACPDVVCHRNVRRMRYRSEAETGSVEWIFVGQLLPRKGLDLLLRSLAALRERRWQLRVVGMGRDEAVYRELVDQLGLADRVEWVGAVANNEVQGWLAAADALILPSRFDGWGAVVNEALSVGTPVLVSDACGAAELVGSSNRGEVFTAESIAALTASLKRHLARGRVDSATRADISAWAASSIASGVVAEYLLNVLRHVRDGSVRPMAPWLR